MNESFTIGAYLENSKEFIMANTRLSDEYNKAALIIAKTFLKKGLDVTLEREDSSDSEEHPIFDGNMVKLNNRLFVTILPTEDDPTKVYDISLRVMVPDYTTLDIDKWKLDIENPASKNETENKIVDISNTIIEEKELGIDTLDDGMKSRSSVKLISNVNKLDRDSEKSKEEEQER